MRFHVESDTISSAGRAAHDIGLAAIVGGNLFARVGMHPAVASISDPAERGEVVNGAWRRYGTVNSLSLAALLAGWAGARLGETRPKYLTETERRLALVKDASLAGLALSGVAAGLLGIKFGRSAPEGAVPLTDGDNTAEEATAGQDRLKRRLELLSNAQLLFGAGIAISNAALSQQSFRRPPARRFFKRRY